MDYEDMCDYSDIDPPNIPKDASPDEIKNIWDLWLKKERKTKLSQKRKWEKELIPQQSPEISMGMLVKQNGIWKQRPMVAFAGDVESGNLEIVTYELPNQDKHFQVRGSRGGSGGGNKKLKRKRKKELKKQVILNKRYK